MLFTKAIVSEWTVTTYNWLIGDMTNILYNIWKNVEFKCDIDLDVNDMPEFKRRLESKLSMFFTSLVCNQSYAYATKQSENFLGLRKRTEEAIGCSFTFKTIEFGGEGENMCYQPTIIINTEYGEKQGA